MAALLSFFRPLFVPVCIFCLETTLVATPLASPETSGQKVRRFRGSTTQELIWLRLALARRPTPELTDGSESGACATQPTFATSGWGDSWRRHMSDVRCAVPSRGSLPPPPP